MKITSHQMVLGLFLLSLTAAAAPANAQGALGRIKDRAKARIEQKVGDKVEKKIDEKMDGKSAGAEEGPGPQTIAGKPDAKPGEGAWVNYDFVPGSRALFVTDFAADKVGDFPRRLRFGDGNIELAEWKGARWLRATTRTSAFTIPLPEDLPERFTIEFDATPSYHNNWMVFRFADGAADDVRFRTIAGKGQAGVFGREHQSQGSTTGEVGPSEVFHGRIMADGEYVKVYMNDTRVANIPNAELGRSRLIKVSLEGTDESPVFISNIAVMAGGRDLYEALSEDGRVATQGILFDTNSDRIRPESTPTLKEIVAMLEEHPELRLTIEGHTDNVGAVAANQALSDKRAAAVKAYLVAAGVDATRLQSKGMGPAKPAAPNTTAEGRQQNRRVELVKM